MKNQVLEQIFNEMIKVEHVGRGHFKYYHKGILSSLVVSCQRKYMVEINDLNIIKDEVYYCVWHAMKKISEDYTVEQLEQILAEYKVDSTSLLVNTFFARVKAYAALDIKKYLINPTKRSSTGDYINMITISTDIYEFESLFKDFDTIEKPESNNHFNKWFLENRFSLLTKKQNEYINGENIKPDAGLTEKDKNNLRVNSWRMRQRISKRVLDKYNSEFPLDNRAAEIKTQIELLENILSGDLVSLVNTYQESDIIIDSIYDYVSKESIVKFNKAVRTNEPVPADVIKEYRTALFKTLRKLYDKQESKSI